MTTKTRTFCVKIYCDLPVLCVGMVERPDNLLDQRINLEQLVEGLGSGVELLGCSGTTTTWNVEDQKLVKLLQKFQKYNNNKIPTISFIGEWRVLKDER